MIVGINASFDAGRYTGSPDAKGADTDAYPRFALLHRVVHILDEGINVRSALGGRFAIWEIGRWTTVYDGGVGVKIVINMDAIDVVAFDDIHDDLERALAGKRGSRIHAEVLFVGPNDGWVGAGDVVARRREGFVRRSAEGVKPCVDLDASGVCLLDAEGEWVVAGVSAHGAAEPLAPGFVVRLVERVGIGADLENDGIDAKTFGGIEHLDELPLLLLGAEAGSAGPVHIIDGGDPRCAEFSRECRRALVGRSVLLCCQREESEDKKDEGTHKMYHHLSEKYGGRKKKYGAAAFLRNSPNCGTAP